MPGGSNFGSRGEPATLITAAVVSANRAAPARILRADDARGMNWQLSADRPTRTVARMLSVIACAGPLNPRTGP